MNYTAIVAFVITVGAFASTALGHPALALVFNDPNTSTTLTAVVGLVGALVSGFSQGVQHPATSVTVPAVAVNTSSPSLTSGQVASVIQAKVDATKA